MLAKYVHTLIVVAKALAKFLTLFTFHVQHSCTKCIARLYWRLPVILVQMRGGWDRFETFVVLEESSTLSDDCNYFN